MSKELEEWEVDGKKAGLYRSSGPFTFLTVDDAGHMVRLAILIGWKSLTCSSRFRLISLCKL